MQIVDANEYDHEEADKNELHVVPHGDISEPECLFFGDFSNKDYDKFFAFDNIRSTSVQFLCDTYNDTQTWVEEGQKHLLDLEPIDDELISFNDNTDVDNVKEEHDNEPAENSEENKCDVNGFVNGEKEDEDVLVEDVIEQVNHLDLKDNEENDIAFTDDEKIDVDVETDNKIENGDLTEKCTDEKSEDGTVTKQLDLKIENEQKNGEQSQKKSWASLFKTSEAAVENTPNGVKSVRAVKVEVPIMNSEIAEKEIVKENGLSMISMEQDERASKLAEFISHWYPDYSRTHVQLHGLVNRANWCYINATLQALLAIPTIYHFYKNLSEFLNEDTKSTSTPLTDSMIAFFNRFEPIEMQGKKDNEELHYGIAFEPKGVYEVLSVMKSSLSEKGRQEDAEEFLSFLLNGIHDELVALSKLVVPKSKAPEITENGDIHDSNESDEEVWEEVGPKNKVRTIRKAVIEESLMKHVFGGVICSSVLQTGAKESTTFQPFFTLQLDIQSENIQTLNNAIEFYFMKEKLQGFTCSKTKTEVEASRRISLEELPLMFIFHLKYFVFDRKGGSQKLHKEIDIPVDLEIPRDILSNSKNPNTTRRYKLHAVVYHHGKHAAGGHYTAAVHHGNPFGWVHFDDNHIKNVNMNDMVKHQQGSVPYLLFYERIQHR